MNLIAFLIEILQSVLAIASPSAINWDNFPDRISRSDSSNVPLIEFTAQAGSSQQGDVG